MRHDIELAYLGIEVPDPAALSPFFGDVIGLVPGEPDGATLTWRNDDAVQRILVEPGPANDATRIGFEATDAAAFAAVVERLRTAGHDDASLELITHGNWLRVLESTWQP